MCLIPNNSEVSQARKLSKGQNGQNYRERLARVSENDSDRAITPAAEAVHVPAHLAPLGSLQAKQQHYLHVNSHWGRAAIGKNKCLAPMCAVLIQ